MQKHVEEFTVELKRVGTELRAEIQLKNPNDDCRKNARYYFYLVKDGQVIDRRGWFVENAFQWTVQETGTYFVQGYVRVGEERALQQSNRVIFIAVKTPVAIPAPDPGLPAGVSIFGSCTTRDLFRLFPSKDVELKTYIARQSVVSAVSQPVPLELEQIKLESAFQRSAVWHDFNKTAFDLFRNDGSEWLIIDLIDERFSPVRIGNSYVTKSAAAVEAGVIKTAKKGSGRLWNGNDFLIDRVSLRSYVIRFAEKLLEIYKPDHIIIHRALNVEQYCDADGNLHEFPEAEKKMAQMVNDIIIYMYDCLKECIPEAHEIDCISKYYGSELHHWGRAPVHYEDGYYEEVMDQVKKVVLKDSIQKIGGRWNLTCRGSDALCACIGQQGGAELISVIDFFPLAQEWSDFFRKDLSSEYYQIPGVEDLDFYTSDRLEDLRHAVESVVRECVKQSQKVVWIDSLFDTRTSKDLIENEKYQKLNWILEEIYGQLSEIPGVTPCDLGKIDITANEVEVTLRQFYQGKRNDIKAFLENVTQEKIGWFDVLASLEGNTFSAEIKIERELNSDLMYLFYLLKDGRVIAKTNWLTKNTYSWDLNESGVYAVQGYVKSGAEKVIRKSIALAYFDDAKTKEFETFMQSYEKTENPFSDPLKFHYLKEPFSDILIVSHKDRKSMLCASEGFINQHDKFEIASDTEIGGYSTQVLATGGIKKMQTGETLVFSGTMDYDGKIILGAADIPDHADVDKLLYNYGDNQIVVASDDGIKLGTDYFNFGRWFYYEDVESGMMVASNRYHTMLLFLKACAVDLKFDERKVECSLAAPNIQFLVQNFTRGMDIAPIFQVESFNCLCLTDKGWAKDYNELGLVLKQRETFHHNVYCAMLKKACAEIKQHVASIAIDERFQYALVDLSGGLDSRLIYAAATHLENGRDKIRISSHPVPGSDDLPIATEINSIYGFEYDNLPRKRCLVPLRDGVQTARSFHIGTYYSYNPFYIGTKIDDSEVKAITLNGACGEILARPYTCRKYFRSMADASLSSEKFAEYVWTDFAADLISGDETTADIFRTYVANELDNVPVDDVFEAYDRIYLQYRHGCHFDQSLKYENGMPFWMPMQSKAAFRLHHMVFSRFRNIKLQLDMIGELNPLLLGIRFDYAKDQEEFELLRDSLEVDARFRNIRIFGQDDMPRWERSQREKERGAEIIELESHLKDKNDYERREKDNLLYTALVNNFWELMKMAPALRERMGVSLYCAIMQMKNSPRGFYYLYNKVTSLLDQLRILNDG